MSSKKPTLKTELNLTDGVDFYLEEDNMVFTETYLSKRGYCCQSGCKHCPYGFSEKVDPEAPSELQDPFETKRPKNYDNPHLTDIELAEFYINNENFDIDEEEEE